MKKSFNVVLITLIITEHIFVSMSILKVHEINTSELEKVNIWHQV